MKQAYNNVRLYFRSKKIFIFIYFATYALTLLPISRGVGNYWDWAFPYFTEGLKNYGNGFQSLLSDNLGTPLSYASNFYFSKVISLFGWTKIPTELLIYLLLVAMLATASFVTYAIARKRISNPLSFLIGLAVVINPAIFYKLLAGHLGYLVSYVLFVTLIAFTLNSLKNNLKSAIILGLILGFVGVQIQFFFFAFLFILLYFLIIRPKFDWKYMVVSLALPVLINLPWLSNFVMGVNSVSSIGSAAASASFSGLMQASFLRLGMMVFSNATVIQYVYPKWAFPYFGITFLLVCCMYAIWLLKSHKATGVEGKENALFLSALSVFFLLGTGLFHQIPLQFVRIFSSIFREIGHFAPLIILFEFLSLAWLLPLFSQKRKLKIALTVYLIGFIAINGYFFVRYLPKVDYSLERSKFVELNDFNKTDQGNNRIITYPFWNQYGFLDTREINKNGRLLNNSGWDSFTAFSGKDFIPNYVLGGKNIDNTLQYRLLNTSNIMDLEQRNVRYIYDLSSIYRSNFDRYTTPETYNDDLSLIKNDPDFLSKLAKKNPNSTVFVDKNILKLTNSLPRIYLESEKGKNGDTILYFQKISNSEYRLRITGLKDLTTLSFLNNYLGDWKVYLSKDSISGSGGRPDWCIESEQYSRTNSFDCASSMSHSFNQIGYLFEHPLVNETEHKEILNYANGWIIDPANLVKGQGKENADGSVDLDVTLFFKPQAYFEIALGGSLLSLFFACVYLVWSSVKSRTNRLICKDSFTK